MNANYQFQLPKIITYPFLVVSLSILISVGFFVAELNNVVRYGVLTLSLVLGLGYLAIYLLIRNFTNLDRRIKDRDFLLKQIPWKGNEKVLDVGCGNGILILSAAKQLTTGHAIGVDMWTENSGNNTKEVFESNAALEGVQDKVEIHSEDARQLPYENNSFDVVLCGLTMHHLLHDKGAERAINEIIRVLKPNGFLAIYDVPIAILSTQKMLRKKQVKLERLNSKILFGVKLGKSQVN